MPYLDNSERYKHSSSWHTEWVCMAAFVLFTFVYLYFYQADVLAAGQHVLSGGQTHYKRFWGAVLITAALCILQRFVYRMLKLRKRAHSLTYLPSLLILTVITDVSSNIDLGFSFGGWLIAIPVIAVLYGVLVVVLQKMEPFEPYSTNFGIFSRTSWINLLGMVVMFVLVGVFSNGDETFHYRMRMEKLILDGKYKKALKVGRKSEVTDNSLTMLRAYALEKEGQLGNRFFEYPLTANSFSLVPDRKKARTVIMPDSLISIYAQKAGVRTDYMLIHLLADRRLQEFAAAVVIAYPDSLMPKHFAEALILYRDIVSKDTIADVETSMERAYRDFCQKEKALPTAFVANAMKRLYGRTYWYYYKYGWKKD